MRPATRIPPLLIAATTAAGALFGGPASAYANMGYWGPGMGSVMFSAQEQRLSLAYVVFAVTLSVASILSLRRLVQDSRPRASAVDSLDPVAGASKLRHSLAPLLAIPAVVVGLAGAVTAYAFLSDYIDISDALSHLGVLVIVAIAPLLITLVSEVVVALCFRIPGRELLSVALVSGATNPLMNLAMTATYTFALGYNVVGPGTYYPEMYDIPSYAPSALLYALFAAAEVVVAVVEWRVLVWAIGERVSSRRLLALSVVMNAASAALSVTHRGSPVVALYVLIGGPLLMPLLLFGGLLTLAIMSARKQRRASS